MLFTISTLFRNIFITTHVYTCITTLLHFYIYACQGFSVHCIFKSSSVVPIWGVHALLLSYTVDTFHILNLFGLFSLLFYPHPQPSFSSEYEVIGLFLILFNPVEISRRRRPLLMALLSKAWRNTITKLSGLGLTPKYRHTYSGLNMELDLQSYLGSMCIAELIG